MKHLWGVVVVGVVVVAGCGNPPTTVSGAAGSSSAPPSTTGMTPTTVVQGFANAWNKRDVNAVVGFILGAKPLGDTAGFFGSNTPILTVEDLKETISGTEAQVHAKVTLTIDKKTQTDEEDIPLRQEGGAWKIVPANPSKPGSMKYLMSIATAMSNPDVIAQARDAAQRTACLSNIKQLSIGVLMYSGDSDDMYPTAGKVDEKLAPYLKNPKLWRCPSDPEGTVSYTFNEKLLGKSAASVASPAETVMIYEGHDGELDFKHNGKAGVGFADGHAKLIDVEGEKKLVWAP